MPRLAAILILGVLALVRAAAAAPPPLDAYGSLPAVSHVSVSPGGGAVASITDHQGDLTFTVRDAAGTVEMTKALGKMKVLGFRWIGERHLLLFCSRYDTMLSFYEPLESELVYVVNLDKKQALYLRRDLQGFAGGFEAGGHAHAYFYEVYDSPSDATRPYLAGSLSLVDLDGGEERLAALAYAHLERAWLTSPVDGAILAEEEYDQRDSHWSVWAGVAHRKLLFEAASPYGLDTLSGLGRTKGTVLISRLDPDLRRWFEVDAATGAQTELQTVERRGWPLFDAASGLLIGAVGDGSGPIQLFDPALQARMDRALTAPAGVVARFAGASRGLGEIVTLTDGSHDSGTWRLVDTATGDSQVVGLEHPDVPPEAVGPVSRVSYAAADGLKLDGVLTLPPGPVKPRLPVVVMPHGGPIAHDGLGFDWWAQAFASRGYAVWQPNFRGSSGEGQALVNAGMGEWGRKMQTDISDGLAELVRRGVVDPKRACIVGASYGGYAALAGVTLQHGLYRCAVAVAGVSDLNSMLHWEAGRNGRVSDVVRYWKHLMGAANLSDPALAAISPARHAAEADAPILLIHGEHDVTVPISQSREMRDALLKAGKPVQFVELPKEDHHLDFEVTRRAMLAASVAFVLKYDPPA